MVPSTCNQFLPITRRTVFHLHPVDDVPLDQVLQSHVILFFLKSCRQVFAFHPCFRLRLLKSDTSDIQVSILFMFSPTTFVTLRQFRFANMFAFREMRHAVCMGVRRFVAVYASFKACGSYPIQDVSGFFLGVYLPMLPEFVFASPFGY